MKEIHCPKMEVLKNTLFLFMVDFILPNRSAEKIVNKHAINTNKF